MKSKKKFNKKRKFNKTHKKKFKNQRAGAIVEYVEKKQLYDNNVAPFQQVVINKNGLVQDENILQDKINLITSKAFKYLQNAQLIRNELYLQELKK